MTLAPSNSSNLLRFSLLYSSIHSKVRDERERERERNLIQYPFSQKSHSHTHFPQFPFSLNYEGFRNRRVSDRFRFGKMASSSATGAGSTDPTAARRNTKRPKCKALSVSLISRGFSTFELNFQWPICLFCWSFWFVVEISYFLFLGLIEFMLGRKWFFWVCWVFLC